MIASDDRKHGGRRWILYDCVTYTAAVLYVLFVGVMYYVHYFGGL